MKTLSLVTATILLTAVGAAAAPASTDPASVPSGMYAIEPTHARVLFAVSHFGVSTWYGDFTHVSGSLKLDSKNPSASSVEVSVPMDSISTTNEALDGTLKGADWFDVAKFPTMTFRSGKMTVTSPGHATIDGMLTLKGVTKPVELEAKFNGAAGPNVVLKTYMIGFELTGRIKRSDFGVRQYLGTISDNVDLIISAPFERKPD